MNSIEQSRKGRTMTTKENAANIEAEKNMAKIMGTKCDLKSVEGKRLAQAWENENAIHIAAENLEIGLARITRNTEEATRYLQSNQVRNINSHGLYQNTIHSVDAAVTTLQLLVKARRLYADLL